MRLDIRTRFILAVAIGGIVAYLVAYLPDALSALGDIL